MSRGIGLLVGPAFVGVSFITGLVFGVELDLPDEEEKEARGVNGVSLEIFLFILHVRVAWRRYDDADFE